MMKCWSIGCLLIYSGSAANTCGFTVALTSIIANSPNFGLFIGSDDNMQKIEQRIRDLQKPAQPGDAILGSFDGPGGQRAPAGRESDRAG